MRLIHRIQLDTDGRVGTVQWQHFNPRTGESIGVPKLVFTSEVLSLLREGEQVGTLFAAENGRMTPGPNVVARSVNGFEELAIEGMPQRGRTFSDLPTI